MKQRGNECLVLVGVDECVSCELGSGGKTDRAPQMTGFLYSYAGESRDSECGDR